MSDWDNLVEPARGALKALLRKGDEMADRIEELEAKLAKAVKTLRELIGHTHNCEKELTEELHNADFCGESLPLTNARTTLAELKGQNDE